MDSQKDATENLGSSHGYWAWIRDLFRRPAPKFHQVILVESNPFGEVVFPFQFSIADNVDEEAMLRISRAAWNDLTGRKKHGFYTSVDAKVVKPTVEDQMGVVPEMNKTYQMGRYTNDRRVHPTTHLIVVD